MNINRITWESARDGGYRGVVVGKLHGRRATSLVFQIFFRPENGRPGYVLMHRLPFQQDARRYPTAKAAMESAERQLVIAGEFLGFANISSDELARLRKIEARMESLDK